MPTFNQFRINLEKKKPKLKYCLLCEGKGIIKEVAYECEDYTGYNSIAYETGNLITCPDCQ